MAYSETVLKQLLSFVPRYEFDALAEVHHAGQKFRSYNRWSQFLALLIGEHPILMRQGRPIQTGIKCYKNSILKRKIL